MYKKELEIAINIAKVVGEYQLKKQDSLKHINLKEDRSPFTEVDTTSEDMIRAEFAKYFPKDGFFGEESGKTEGTSGRRWIVDPLDGTRPYIHKIPTFSTLIALEDNNEIVVGVANFPALNECYYASKNGGAFCNSEVISVSKTSNINDVMGSALGVIEDSHRDNGQKLFRFMKKWDYIYGFMDAYSYMAVASGKLDTTVALIDFPWDRAPAAIIVKEAGGKFASLNGKESIYEDSFFVSNNNIFNGILEEF